MSQLTTVIGSLWFCETDVMFGFSFKPNPALLLIVISDPSLALIIILLLNCSVDDSLKRPQNRF